MIAEQLKNSAKWLVSATSRKLKEHAQRLEQEKAEQQQQAEIYAEQQRMYEIIYYLSDAVTSVLKPGAYNFVLEDIYEERQFEENGYVWTEPVIVDRVRRAYVQAKPLLDCKYSDVFRVAIFGNISEENMIALTDYFRRVPGYEFKKVGVVVSGLAKELVFCATNNAEDYALIKAKLASRDETRMP